MSEVYYQGRGRGGLINFVIVDDVKQLKIWGPRFELTNFVDLLPYLDEGFVAEEGTGAIPLGVYRRERAMLLPQVLQENTTFYTVVDWVKMEEQAKGSGQAAWNFVCSQLNIPKHMTFIPTKVLLLTDTKVASLRDQTSEQAAFIAGILHREGFAGEYLFSDGIPNVKGVVLKDSSVDKSAIERIQDGLNPNNEQTIGEALTLEQAVHGVLRRALVQGSNIKLQGLDDGRVAVIIQTDDTALVQAFEASRQRNVPS